MSVVKFPIMYIPDPTKGRPVFNGSVYFGEPDLDPTIPANQKQVYYIQENGDLVAASQPVMTSAGGVPVYNGSPVTLNISGEYSMAVLDKNLVQVYYIARTDSSGGNGDNVITYAEDPQVLSSGQLVVDFIGITVSRADIYVGRNGGDRGKLFEGDDYTVTGGSQITLTSSFNAGTKLIASSSEITGRTEFVKKYLNLELAVADPSLTVDDAVNLKERVTGHGGSAFWDVVLTSSVTPNTYNIVQCVGDPLLSLVLRVGTEFNAKQFGALGDGINDDTLAIKATMAASLPTRSVVLIPTGSYLVTDTLPLEEGHYITGQKLDQYPDGFSQDPLSTTILFRPLSAKSLFVSAGVEHGGFRFYQSLQSMYIEGNGNSTYALDLNGVIYANFKNLSIKDFDEPIRCSATINNRFDNIYCSGRTSCISYEGNIETTDLWQQCSFFSSPIGVKFRGTSISIRFSNCLFEQLNTGAEIRTECQSLVFSDCYSEDIAFDGDTSGSMFQIGVNSGTATIENVLIINGGKYSGRNAGAVGSFLNIDKCNGVLVSDVNVSRFTFGIKTTANTRDDSIVLNGMQGISVDTWVDDFNKIVGIYPHESIGTSGAQSRVRAPVILTNELRPSDDSMGVLLARTGDKLSLFGAAPILQPSSSGETVGFIQNGGAGVNDQSTFTGNIGATAYRINDIVKSLKQVGLLAE